MSYLIAGCAAVLVGTIAVSLSVSRMVGKKAVFTFYIAVVSYIAATAALDQWLRQAGLGAGEFGKGVTPMTAVNPFLALHALLNPSSYPRAEAGSLSGLRAFLLERPVTAWCVLSSGLSVALVAVSALTLRMGGLGQMASGRAGVPWYRRVMGLGGKGAEHRPPRPVGTNPIAWREASARNATFGRIVARWSFCVFGAVIAVALVLLYHTGRLSGSTFRLALLSTVWTEMTVITLVGMNMAATAISREREDGTLDLLLTTPITPRMYLSGKLHGLIAYLLPLLAIPIGTLLIAGGYVMAGGFGREGGVLLTSGGMSVPVVVPEAGILAAPVMVTFVAFCVMVGLQWSLKSKGTISSVIGTVGVVAVIGGTLGLCGWQSGSSIDLLGPAFVTMTPVTLAYAVVNPEVAMFGTVSSGSGLASARWGLIVGAVVSSGIYMAVVYGIRASLVRNFDFTVRKLAGVR
ncbi:MAG: hypothetical protein D6695_02255 [Planctomycetota bacterium]|nr:MAG: hypothetical protein D6695_02255 [Planctomycetota bacterium]